MKKALAICGAICSGKSSVINYLANLYDWNVISFGDYVRYIATEKRLAPTRESFQTLGQDLISNRGARTFLEDVIQFNAPRSAIHLFDGIRHASIVDALRDKYTESLVIFLNVSDYQRYLRFKVRLSPGDPILSYSEFLDLSMRPVERGLATIATVAELSVDASIPFKEVITNIEIELVAKQFI